MGVCALADKFSVRKTKIITNKNAIYKIWAANGKEKQKSINLQKIYLF